MIKILLLALATIVLGEQVARAAVISIVIGASGAGTIDGLYFGNYQDSGGSNLYGFGAPSVDKDALVSDYEELYPDPLLGDPSLPSLPPMASIGVGLDMSLDNSLKIVASSKLLDTSSIASGRNDHAGVVEFSLSKDASVVANFTGSSSALVTIRDNFANVLWTSGDGTVAFSVTSGAYWAEYSLSAEFGPGTFLTNESLELNLAFTPAVDPTPPTDPNPPPGPEVVPEPTSVLTWAAGLGVMHLGFRRSRAVVAGRFACR
jgi:hypothetical protein